MPNGPPFLITETWPTALVRDFGIFLSGLEDPKVYLSPAKKVLNRQVLYELDQRMETFQTRTHPRTDQEYYPLLHLFQRICVSGRFFVAQIVRGKLRMVPTPRLAEFKSLTPTGQYLALLETFWVDCDWEDLFSADSIYYRRMDLILDEVLDFISHCPLGEDVRLGGRSGPAAKIARTSGLLIRVFSFFGFVTCVENTATKDPYHSRRIFLSSVTLTEFGAHFLDALDNRRSYPEWNRHTEPFGLGFDFEEEEEKARAAEDAAAKQEAFVEAFRPLVAADQVEKVLSPMVVEVKEGTYVFEVKLGKVSRTIAMSHHHTLFDLHEMIQKGFKFDNDHLFAFFMDGKAWSDHAYNDSRGDDEGPYADMAPVGRLDLSVGQTFLYLFDFGDEWRFEVKVREIRAERYRGKPKIIEAKGEPPEQYGPGDEDRE